MKRDDPRHGTHAGYQVHRREGKTPCRRCRDAHAAYQKKFRGETTGWAEQQRARNRAMWRLVDLHREEFDALYVEERMKDHVAKASKRQANRVES